MQKISGILPSSSRLTSVDLKESGAARPGAPSFGRPLGESNLMSNSITRSAHRALQQHNEISEARSKDQKQAREIQKMADEFFKSQVQINKEKDLVSEILYDQTFVPDTPPTVAIPFDDVGVINFENEKPLDMDVPDIGRYIDVMV